MMTMAEKSEDARKREARDDARAGRFTWTEGDVEVISSPVSSSSDEGDRVDRVRKLRDRVDDTGEKT
jgi:hypothetical protein